MTEIDKKDLHLMLVDTSESYGLFLQNFMHAHPKLSFSAVQVIRVSITYAAMIAVRPSSDLCYIMVT